MNFMLPGNPQNYKAVIIESLFLFWHGGKNLSKKHGQKIAMILNFQRDRSGANNVDIYQTEGRRDRSGANNVGIDQTRWERQVWGKRCRHTSDRRRETGLGQTIVDIYQTEGGRDRSGANDVDIYQTEGGRQVWGKQCKHRSGRRSSLMKFYTVCLPSHVQGLEMITLIISTPDLRLAFCWYLIIWKTLSLKYFPNFPPVKRQLTSMDQGQAVINS